MTSSGMRGVLNDATSIASLDASLAVDFIAWWCVGYRIETADGAFQIRTDTPHHGSPPGWIGRRNTGQLF